VELNGAFIGSTPMKRQLTAGNHQVSVRHGSAVWQRTVNVQSGEEITINAILKK
jgi:hypothetical protein